VQSSVSVVVRGVNVAAIAQRQFGDSFVPVLSGNYKYSVPRFVLRIWIYAHVENFL